MKKFKTNKIVTTLMLVSLILVSFGSFAQKKTLMTEDDGFKWYKLEQNGKVGAQSTSGVTFIPLSRGYTYIFYSYPFNTPNPFPPYVGWFSVKKNSDSRGACDKNGREIVAPGRYDWVEYYDSGGYVFCIVELNGREGVCDENGREVIAPRYKNLFFSRIEHVFSYEDASGNYVLLDNPLKNSSGTGYATGSSSNSGSSSSSNTVTPTPQPQPQPQPQPRQLQPMQVWKPCPFCQGSGKCHVCLGDGHPLTNPTGTCIVCNGRGICSHCAGHGGQNVIEYH